VGDRTLLTAAGRIADGEQIDWASITSTLPSEEDRAIAGELAVVAQIAAEHRQLHQLLPVSADTPANLVPDRARWGHLDLLNIVSRGSYGIVYRAWDTRLERVVALKLFHGASNPDAVIHEGRMLARVRHENVVVVYGADVLDGVAGIWMELVHGRTLDNLVKGQGPMPGREAAKVGADIARALAAVHAAGLLHCDVKAQNVVYESGGRVVLMDLSAGRLVPEARDTDDLSDVAGTPRYMAPELFEVGATATRATDIYSFGVLLYFLVSGKFPVDGKTLGELRKAHHESRRRSLGDVCRGLPAGFIEIVSKTLDPDPARRPESAAEVQAALTSLASVPVTAPRPRSLWWTAIPALAVLIIAAVLWVRPPAPVVPEVNTLAVLPIANFTGDPTKQYLADGLTEVILAHLARVPGMLVASSATMSAVRGMDNERAIAEKLGVRLLLAGSVLQADNRIVLSVRLTDPHDGRVIWGSQLERLPSNILGARFEIANLVAARLSVELPQPRAADSHQLKAEAQEAFIRGLVEVSTVSDDRMLEGVRLFERAVTLEPAWAEPLAYLAYAQQYTSEFGDPALRAERAEVVRANALRAIQLDPGVPMSYTALAAVQAYHDWDFKGAEATLRQGLIALPADGFTRGRLALLLAAAGRLEEAIGEAERSRDGEPLVPERYVNLGMVRYYARDFDLGLADMEQALKLSPNFGPALIGKGRIYAALGRYDDAARHVRQAIALSANPGSFALLGMVYAQAGRSTELNDVMARLRAFESEGTFVSLDNYGYIAAHQGRLDEAFQLVNDAITRRMTGVVWLAVDARADAMRSDPRFEGLLARMRFVAR
jgi:TolB-like protein/Tfp pilus assembly protein PilF